MILAFVRLNFRAFYITICRSFIVNIEIFRNSKVAPKKKIIYKKSEFDINLIKGRC